MDNLREVMEGLVLDIKDWIGNGMKEHQELCQQAATEYRLWHDEMFPIWLSRVVEGVIRDVKNGE